MVPSTECPSTMINSYRSEGSWANTCGRLRASFKAGITTDTLGLAAMITRFYAVTHREGCTSPPIFATDLSAPDGERFYVVGPENPASVSVLGSRLSEIANQL